MRILASVAFLAAAHAADQPGPEYSQAIEQWRAQHAKTLQSETGWLHVAGLFWLKEGANRAGTDASSDIVLPDGPKNAGVFTLREGAVRFESAKRAALALEPNADIVPIGRLKLFVIVRGDRVGLRMRDPQSALLREFQGLQWYPIETQARIVAKFVVEPRKIRVPNILGQDNEQESPGYAEFAWRGKQMRLYPVREEKRLFFIFRDQTSGRGTYGAGRFLYADFATDGVVVLDFNQAENPPCAYTPFATCPLPPKENRLDVKIEAGERDYGHR